MEPTITRLFHFVAFGLFCAAILLTTACDDDDLAIPQEYDALEHIYVSNANYSTLESQEAIVNPSTGAYRFLDGMTESFGSLSIPIGPRFLTDFVNKRRIYPGRSNGDEAIIFQDLETLEKMGIDTNALSTFVSDWDFLTFGPNNNTLYGYDIADTRFFALDIPSQEISVIGEGLPVIGASVKAFEYFASTNEVALFSNDTYLIYDLANQTISGNASLSKELFGFTQHPDTDQIYALTRPNSDQSFRLVELIRTENTMTVKDISTENLPIDNLSPNLQTIHAASNTFICRGGSANFDTPETILYSIDLNTGELLHNVKLDGFRDMLKLRGE